MQSRGKSLGILLSRPPDHPNFRHGIQLASAALGNGLGVYLYCLDDAVIGIDDAQLQSLRRQGLKLFACAFAAHRRDLAVADSAVFGGLGILADLVAHTDRFVSFN